MRSAIPGTNTTANVRPRAACGVPTKTRPCRRRGGSCVSVSRRGVSTSRTSRRVTGPTLPSGAISASTRATRAGWRSTSGTSAANSRIQSAQVRAARHVSSVVTIGSANASRWPSCSRSRSMPFRRGESRSSSASSRQRRSYSFRRPGSRRCQRSRPPIT